MQTDTIYVQSFYRLPKSQQITYAGVRIFEAPDGELLVFPAQKTVTLNLTQYKFDSSITQIYGNRILGVLNVTEQQENTQASDSEI